MGINKIHSTLSLPLSWWPLRPWRLLGVPVPHPRTHCAGMLWRCDARSPIWCRGHRTPGPSIAHCYDLINKEKTKDSMHLNVRCKIQTWWGFGVFYNTLIYCFIGDKHYSLKSHKEKIKRQLWKWIKKRMNEWLYYHHNHLFWFMHLSETDMVNWYDYRVTKIVQYTKCFSFMHLLGSILYWYDYWDAKIKQYTQCFVRK